VFLPKRPGETGDLAAQQRLLELAKRVVRLEKPAHTAFELKFYWAAFRLGEARLGADTVIDLGSRAPGLLRPLVLGAAYTGAAYPASGCPCSPRQRPFLKSGACAPVCHLTSVEEMPQ
jgi:hypothetical protein